MTLTTDERSEITPSAFLVMELHARYYMLIDRYVRHRLHDPVRSAEVVREVFARAASDPDSLPQRPLPLLIAIARHEIAEILTEGPLPTERPS
jgi:DNA-directed RNA polymerase specialized sigma24 family protein